MTLIVSTLTQVEFCRAHKEVGLSTACIIRLDEYFLLGTPSRKLTVRWPDMILVTWPSLSCFSSLPENQIRTDSSWNQANPRIRYFQNVESTCPIHYWYLILRSSFNYFHLGCYRERYIYSITCTEVCVPIWSCGCLTTDNLFNLCL